MQDEATDKNVEGAQVLEEMLDEERVAVEVATETISAHNNYAYVAMYYMHMSIYTLVLCFIFWISYSCYFIHIANCELNNCSSYVATPHFAY